MGQYRRSQPDRRQYERPSWLRAQLRRRPRPLWVLITAHVLALNLELVPAAQARAVAESLRALLRAKGDHLDTGFVGTYQLCPTLSRLGMTDVAYTLLLNEDYPSWLHQNHRDPYFQKYAPIQVCCPD